MSSFWWPPNPPSLQATVASMHACYLLSTIILHSLPRGSLDLICCWCRISAVCATFPGFLSFPSIRGPWYKGEIREEEAKKCSFPLFPQLFFPYLLLLSFWSPCRLPTFFSLKPLCWNHWVSRLKSRIMELWSILLWRKCWNQLPKACLPKASVHFSFSISILTTL